MKIWLVQPALRHEPSDHNLEVIRGHLRAVRADIAPEDIVLLPERFELREHGTLYEDAMVELARELGCTIIAGSHREPRGASAVNTGLVIDGAGTILGRYEKLRPYGAERQWVTPGTLLGEITIASRRVLVLVCADFWFVDLVLRASAPPDLIAVPALSVTRQSTPDYSRALWRHLAVARAYEFGSFVAVSDWSHRSALPLLAPAGVAGFADPTPRDPERLFQPLGERPVAAFELDFEALERFRADRRSRGFYFRDE
nr:MAG: hypothetical protein DIU78_09035 [Pseudomonadota bacterium]